MLESILCVVGFSIVFLVLWLTQKFQKCPKCRVQLWEDDLGYWHCPKCDFVRRGIF